MNRYLAAAAVAVSLTAGGAASAATMIIGDFLVDQTVGAPALSPSFPSNSVVPDASALGGFRELNVVSSATAPTPLQTTGVVSGGVLGFSNSIGVSGTLTVTWDAMGAGLGGIDLTGGGIYDRFYIALLESDLGLMMTVDVDGVSSTNSFASGAAPVTSFFNFSSFAGGDLTSVDSIKLILTGPTNLDATVDVLGVYGPDITAVPLPAAGLPLLAGIAALGAIGRRRRRAA